MKPAIETPFMKARNLEDLEKIRQSKRQIVLYEMRDTTHNGVELELEMAMANPQMIQNIWDSVPNIAQDISSMTFKTRVAAIHKIHFIIVVLRHVAATQQYVEALLQSGITRRLLLYISSHQLRRGHTLIKAAEVLKLLIHEYPLLAQQDIIDHGGAATFVRLLHSSQNKMKALALGAISCVRQLPRQYRDELLDHGAVTLIADLLRPLVQLPMLDVDHEELLYTAVRGLPGLCSGDPLPALHQVEILIPIVQTLILTIEPIGIYSYISVSACWTLRYILQILKTDQQLQAQEIVNSDLCQRLILLMQSANDELLVGAAHLAVYELMMSDHAFVQVLVNNEILSALNLNLNRAPSYQGLACNTIYGMIHYDQAAVQQILFDGNLMAPVLQIIQDDNGENSTKVAAVVVISEAARIASDVHIDMMVDLECIQILCEHLNNAEIRALCIEGLRNVILNGNRQREIAQLVGQFGGDTLGALRNDENVGELAQWILENI